MNLDRNELRKNQKGMTLVELVVSMTLATIILVVSAGIFFTSSGVFQHFVIKNEARQMAEYVSLFLTEQLSYADELEVSHLATSEAGGNHVLKFSENGKIYLDGQDLYTQAFYHNKLIHCKVKELQESDENCLLEIGVMIKKRNGQAIYSEGTVVKLINLELKDTGIQYSRCGEEDTGFDSGGQDFYLYYKVEKDKE